MKATMDMTTGLWEKELTPDVRLVSDDSSLPRDGYKMYPVPHAGLHEYVSAQPLYAGMPVEVATQDVGRFISRMDGLAS